ncbi:MAG TPA: hypothetical protein VII95_08535 [Terriglobales bacterium]|jgi:hypothetical protein
MPNSRVRPEPHPTKFGFHWLPKSVRVCSEFGKDKPTHVAAGVFEIPNVVSREWSGQFLCNDVFGSGSNIHSWDEASFADVRPYVRNGFVNLVERVIDLLVWRKGDVNQASVTHNGLRGNMPDIGEEYRGWSRSANWSVDERWRATRLGNNVWSLLEHGKFTRVNEGVAGGFRGALGGVGSFFIGEVHEYSESRIDNENAEARDFDTLFPWWVWVVSLPVGFCGISWGWWNLRDSHNLPWSEICFYIGCVLFMYGCCGLVIWISNNHVIESFWRSGRVENLGTIFVHNSASRSRDKNKLYLLPPVFIKGIAEEDTDVQRENEFRNLKVTNLLFRAFDPKFYDERTVGDEPSGYNLVPFLTASNRDYGCIEPQWYGRAVNRLEGEDQGSEFIDFHMPTIRVYPLPQGGFLDRYLFSENVGVSLGRATRSEVGSGLNRENFERSQGKASSPEGSDDQSQSQQDWWPRPFLPILRLIFGAGFLFSGTNLLLTNNRRFRRRAWRWTGNFMFAAGWFLLLIPQGW